MHRSPILPPSTESRQQLRTRKWLPQESNPTDNSRPGMNESYNANVVQQYSGDKSSDSREVSTRQMGRPSLKHRLDDSSIEISQHTYRIGTDDNILPSQGHDHLNLAASIPGNLISTNPSSSRPNLLNIGSPRSLSDRRKTTASQVSRRFAIGLNSSSASNQTIRKPNQRAIHPIPMSTVPLLNSQLRSQDLTKTRKSSEFGKRMILPVVPEASIINTKAKKKTKFTPPLLSGGYAERFLNLMTYHKSEYTMWANATLRKVKLFGSTEPLAIMEIVSISSEGSLQWARCNVILCENEKSPFYVISKEDEYYCIGSPNLSQILQTDMNENSENLAIEESDIVRSTPSQDISLWNSQEDAIMEEDDSIYGLHKDISKMGVLISSQGSGLDNTNGPKNQHYQPSHCNNILGVASEGETRASSGIQYLKSSQGSDDEVEEPEFRIGRSKEVKRSKLNIRDVSRTVTLPCIGEPPQTENILPADEVNYNDAATSQWNVEALEKSNASSTNNTLPSSKIMGKAVESAILRDSIEPDSGIWILFSNLFNWSRLKVADRVEIHDPCRKILVPNPRSNDPHTAMWIVERYVVVPPDV